MRACIFLFLNSFGGWETTLAAGMANALSVRWGSFSRKQEFGRFTAFPATRSTASRTEPKNFWDGSVVTVLIKRQILLGKLEVSHGTKRSGSNVGNA